MSESLQPIDLDISNLAVARGGRRIVEGASFKLASGEALLLKGANGAGKTSLLRAIGGLLPAADGKVRINGAAGAGALRAACIYQGHLDGVKSAQTGREHLQFWAALYGAPQSRIDDAIEAFDLGAFLDLRASALSAGQRRRLGLARLVLSGKPIWLLDEPTAQIDAASADRLVALIGRRLAGGGAAIVATHDRIALVARTLIVGRDESGGAIRPLEASEESPREAILQNEAPSLASSRSIVAIIARDLALALRAGGGALQSVLFFALATLLFALAIGPDLALQARLAAPVLWTIALLSMLVSLDRLFQADFEDGALDALIETADPLELTVFAKALAHWLSTGLPVVAAAPAAALLLNLPASAYGPLMLSLLIGTPALSFTGAIGAGVALGLKRAAILVAVISAPLYAPALIFGVGAASAGAAGSPEYAPSLMFLAAITLISAIIGPLAGAAAIRLNMN